jgi:pimeloyl-ACP methyl ester carboxylesterase
MDKMVYRVLAATSLVVLGFIAVGGLMTAAAGTPSLRGQRIDIGDGRHMRLICEGPAAGTGPTILFEAGAFGFSADWGAVQESLTKSGQRSCAYDRAGLGQSDPGQGPRDASAIVGDLEKLLTLANEPGPYIYVGHSMAGVYARLFTARNADKVVGVVLVDAASPEATAIPQVAKFVGAFATASRVASWGASTGLFKPLSGTRLGDKIGLPPAASAEKRRAFASGIHARTAANEVAQWPQSAKQAASAGQYASTLPVMVVTAGPAAGARKQWKDLQAAPALASQYGVAINVPEASHTSVLGPLHNGAILQAIAQVRKVIDTKG